MSELKILIVDDSLFFREVLARGLNANLSGAVQIEKAGDPFEARDKILSFDPDVMILDVEMPKMNGIEFLRRLVVQYALPTVVLSSRPAYKNLALEVGAFSFVEKPSTTLGSGDFMKVVADEVRKAKDNAEQLIKDMQKKAAETDINRPAPVVPPAPMAPPVTPQSIVQSAQKLENSTIVYSPISTQAGNGELKGNPAIVKSNLSKVMANMKIMAEAVRDIKKQSGRPEPVPISMDQVKIPVPPRKVELIAIGASTGGTEALSQILKALRPPLPPIVIVQHIPPMFSRLFSERLNNECEIRVKEAADNDRLEPNCVYVAPGERQMRVKNTGGIFTLDVNPGPKYGGHCPSVDVLFESVADNIGDRAMGVILTGMGEDGAKMMLKMRQRGCVTIGQDEASAVVYGMPRVAFELGAVMQQVPLSGMATVITTIARQ